MEINDRRATQPADRGDREWMFCQAQLGIVICAALMWNCGPPCRDRHGALAHVRASRGIQTSDGRPHAILTLPYEGMNRLLVQAAPFVQPIALPLPRVLRALPIGAIEFVITNVQMVAAPNGAMAFEVDISLRREEQSLLDIKATVEAEPKVERRGPQRSLIVGIGADAVRSAKLVFVTEPIEALVQRLTDKVPDSMKQRIDWIARVLARYLGRDGFTIIRTELLSRLGDVTRLRVAMPDIPISKLDFRQQVHPQSALVIHIFTSLPVQRGIASGALPGVRSKIVYGTAGLRLANQTVTELANWAVVTQTASKHLDFEQNRADDSSFPIFSWRDNERALQIDVFRPSHPCGQIRIGVRPTARLYGHEINLGFRDGTIERVRGSAAIKLGVWLERLFAGTIERSVRLAARANIDVGSRRLSTSIMAVEWGSEELSVEIHALSAPRVAGREPVGIRLLNEIVGLTETADSGAVPTGCRERL